MQVQFLGQKNPLEEEMATHSSILSWEILSRLQSHGAAKSRTQWSTQELFLISSRTVVGEGVSEESAAVNDQGGSAMLALNERGELWIKESQRPLEAGKSKEFGFSQKHFIKEATMPTSCISALKTHVGLQICGIVG